MFIIRDALTPEANIGTKLVLPVTWLEKQYYVDINDSVNNCNLMPVELSIISLMFEQIAFMKGLALLN